MLTDWHDLMTKLFKDDTVLAADVLREFMGVPLRTGVKPVPLPQVLSDKPPSDLIPDLVFLVGPGRNPSRVIIVEIQTKMTREKRRQWPRYAAVLWAHYECPVDLLVICPDEAAARSCADPIETSLDRYICLVKVLFPSMVPHLTTRDEVKAYPGLGVLSLCYHGTDPRVTEAFVAGAVLLPPDQAKTYYNYAYYMAAPAVQQMMEELVTSTYQMPLSPSFRKEHDAGVAEGEIRGERNTVLMVLKARNLTPTKEQRGLVESCEDLDTLKLWAERGVTATSIDDVFK